jgi:ketosteroid isomerase-like protein
MSGDLETVVRDLMSTMDRKDWAGMASKFTSDAQGVDELSRKWMRGSQQIDAYFTEFGPMMSDIRSDLSDVHESQFGDSGVVTLWMEQDYKLNGEQQHFSGPMTIVLRRQGSDWRVSLIHAVPLPPGA